MDPSDPPDAWDAYLNGDDDPQPQKHPPNSWTVRRKTRTRKTDAEIPPPDPKVPWILTSNDKRFLSRILILPD
jgi:hypothetical protein